MATRSSLSSPVLVPGTEEPKNILNHPKIIQSLTASQGGTSNKEAHVHQSNEEETLVKDE